MSFYVEEECYREMYAAAINLLYGMPFNTRFPDQCEEMDAPATEPLAHPYDVASKYILNSMERTKCTDPLTNFTWYSMLFFNTKKFAVALTCEDAVKMLRNAPDGEDGYYVMAENTFLKCFSVDRTYTRYHIAMGGQVYEAIVQLFGVEEISMQIKHFSQHCKFKTQNLNRDQFRKIEMSTIRWFVDHLSSEFREPLACALQDEAPSASEEDSR
ncbi:uncharacterized protein LOC135836906 [Planococcus citri]|uniref:uncharacterized protein LOC135836906 n=1 Tax=Planococcus citri TaxID=170843 RepID=UPI0031F77042